jgi:antitoxin VapB
MKIAKVFWSGRSQAVRLPKEFRVDAREVRIRRQRNAIILEPTPASWDWLDKIEGAVDPDFIEAIIEDPGLPEHPAADRLDWERERGARR